MDRAVRSLQAIGALSDAAELTPLGGHLARLPVDARVRRARMTRLVTCVQSDARRIVGARECNAMRCPL